MNDARVAAWIAAFDCIDNSAKILRTFPLYESRPYIDVLMKSAEHYAALACAPEDVGARAAAVLLERATDEQREEQRVNEFLKDLGLDGDE